ncbi:Alpha/beta hydrolase family-domain-containing protein [Lipomyces arxii]|uniref:Alpha/beta hydrolase family-domain-containing protein n=1 Tax=Lipomyces arxii TaxID=56418 RepID=UPI0034CED25F
MTDFTYSTTVVNAAFPRAKRHSTVKADDRLQVAVGRYVPSSQRADGLTLVFLHCTGSVKESWEVTIKEIFKHSVKIPIREAVTIDWVGHGDSAVLNKGKLGYDILWSDGARDMIEVVGQLKLQQPIVPIGHSMGGGQVLMACNLRPRLFTACVAIEATIYPFPLDGNVALTVPLLISMPDEFANIKEGVKYLQATSKWFNANVLAKLAESAFYHPYGDDRVAFKSSVQQQAILFNSDDSLREGLALIHFVETPVLLCVAELGKWNPDEAPKAISRALKNSETVVIPGARHMVVQQLPVETAKFIVPYLLKTWNNWSLELQSEQSKSQRQLEQENNAGFKAVVNGWKENAERVKAGLARKNRSKL